MDPYTGNILGMAGGVGEKNANLLLNRACDTVRPPGSSIKPIAVYGPALSGLITQKPCQDAGPVIQLMAHVPETPVATTGIVP